MAGVKGRSGGPRPGSGGDGRPPNPPDLVDVAETSDPLEFLRSVMNDGGTDVKIRVDAAKALASFTLSKPGVQGKKAAKQEEAAKVAARFGALDAPARLKAV